jgi:CubicO group peptidase (beta-lactamase class C family)
MELMMSGFEFPLATRRQALLGAATTAGVFLASGARAQASPLDLAKVDALVQATMAAFGQPGVGLAIVQNGRVLAAKGYGVRKLGDPAPVDEATVFAIASNSKAYAAAALAILVEDGKLGWDDPVVKHMPDFRMYDDFATREMTVRDLLVHRSGLGLGQGDLMVWPTTTHTRAEIMHGLRWLKPARSFRSGYAYDNVLYVVAGLLTEKVSGLGWEAFVQTRILNPAGMKDSAPAPSLSRAANHAWPHARVSGIARGLGPLSVIDYVDSDNAAPAGGLHVSPRDAARWLQIQLAEGALPAGGRLWSAANAKEMWTPQVFMNVGSGATDQNPKGYTFRAYALGWIVEDYRSRKVIWHSGSVSGQTSVTVLVPSKNAGFMFMTNAEEGGVGRVLRNTLIDMIIGDTSFDWLADTVRREAEFKKEDEENARKAAAQPAGGGKPPALPLKRYAGVYRDPWYGTVTVKESGGRLAISFDKSPTMKGPLEPFDGDVFRTRFPDRNVEDAFVTFETDGQKVLRATLKAVSPSADFSYDYQDLLLTPAG